MAIKFQYNKTSLQTLGKALKVREKALPTIKSKESALRLEARKSKEEAGILSKKIEECIKSYDSMFLLWSEFREDLVSVTDVKMETRKFAGVSVPMLNEVCFEVKDWSLFNAPHWFYDGVAILKEMAQLGIEHEVALMKLSLFEQARRKTTQKVNLFEKVQIPGYKDAIRKIKRFMEDEESLSKSSQKILKSRQEKQREEARE
ncbi:MAG TPA: V-type ATP synthase subunit D [Porphyromonadaceae bacterium]|nr:V-type ATP synthase subunit D [Porphyromonadaceae bacterium]